MKIWKKFSLVLCLCFAFSDFATACGSGNDSSSVDSSVRGGESSVSDSSVKGTDVEIGSEEYMDMALEIVTVMLGEVRSAKFDIELGATVQATTAQGASSSGVWTNYKLTGEAIVSVADTGFNAKLNLQLPACEAIGAVEEREFYLLDGYVYEYHKAEDVYERYRDTLYEIVDEWIQTNSEGKYSLSTLLAGFGGSAAGGLPSFELVLTPDELQSMFGNDSVIEPELTENGVMVTIDSSAAFGSLFDFIDTIDETTTYGELIDYPLSVLFPDSDLTADDIVDELYTHDDDTVSEFVAMLEEEVLTYTGNTLQGNYDAIFKNEFAYGLLVGALGEEGASALRDFEIASIVEQYGELTLDELVETFSDEIVSVLAEFGATFEDFSQLSGMIDWNTLMYVLGEMLEMPALENLEEDSAVYKVLEFAKTMDVTKAETSVEIGLPNFILDTVTVGGTLGIGIFQDNTAYTVEIEAVIVASELRSIKRDVALPEEAIVVIECDQCGELKEDTLYREDAEEFYCEDCYAQLPGEPGTEPELEPAEPSEPTDPTEPMLPSEPGVLV